MHRWPGRGSGGRRGHRCTRRAQTKGAGGRAPAYTQQCCRRVLGAAPNLYGVQYAVENPRAQLGMEAVLLVLPALVLLAAGAAASCTAGEPTTANYCQCVHLCQGYQRVGDSGSMGAKGLERQRLCRAATGYCRKDKGEAGEISAKAGRWSHLVVIGGGTAKAAMAKEHTKGEPANMNRVPAMLLLGLLQEM